MTCCIYIKFEAQIMMITLEFTSVSFVIWIK